MTTLEKRWAIHLGLGLIVMTWGDAVFSLAMRGAWIGVAFWACACFLVLGVVVFPWSRST